MEWETGGYCDRHWIICRYGRYTATIERVGKNKYHCWTAKGTTLVFSTLSKLSVAELKRRLENKLIKYTFDENNVVSN